MFQQPPHTSFILVPQMPLDAPERFRVEIWFSAGSSVNPIESDSGKLAHVLPVTPPRPLHGGEGVVLQKMESLLSRFYVPPKSRSRVLSKTNSAVSAVR